MTKKKLTRIIISTAALCLLMINSKDVKAQTTDSNTAVAGMSKLMEDYYSERLSESGISIENVTTPFYIDGERVEPVNTGTSPYEGLAFSNTQEFVNIRRKASTNSKIVGKLYRASVATVIKKGEEWSKIKSGNVEGFILNTYLLYGDEAEKLAEESCTKYAMPTCVTLNVRMGPSTEEKIITQIPQGEKFEIKKIHEDWFEIILDIDDNTGEAVTGFISKDYADIVYEFNEAVTIEEEQAALAAAEASKQAEEERLQQLAQEQAQSSSSSSNNSSSSSSNSGSSSSRNSSNSSSNSSKSNSSSSSSSNSSASTGSSSSLGQQIADYAVKFVGNPYVWGGTSLTNGADCSGFVYAVYQHFGYTIPRVSRDQSRSAGSSVNCNTSSLQPGDLLFYGDSSGYVDHVAMYIGNGKVVHASNPSTGIRISVWNYRTPINARRVIN